MNARSMLALAAVLSVPTAGASGALPKGELPPEESALKQGEGEPAEAKSRGRVCFLDLAEPPGSPFHFDADGKTLWALVSRGPAKAAAGKAAAGKPATDARQRYVLYRVPLKTRRGEPQLALEQGAGASLLAHGAPVSAVSLVTFTGPAANCRDGAAGVVSVALGKKADAAVQAAGAYRLLHGSGGLLFADAKKSQVILLDPQTFQQKHARKVGEKERPLYFDAEAGRLVAWYDDGAKRGLVDGKKRLEFKKGDRVLQHGGAFGVMRPLPSSNALELRELKGWTTGVDKPASFKVKLPPAYPVTSAGAHVHFGKRLALVHGASDATRRRWQRLFVFDYTKPDPIVAVPVTGTQYIGAAALDPTGAHAVIELRDMATQKTEALKVYDIAKRAFLDVSLPAPK